VSAIPANIHPVTPARVTTVDDSAVSAPDEVIAFATRQANAIMVGGETTTGSSAPGRA